MTNAEKSAAWRAKNPKRAKELWQRSYSANKKKFNARAVALRKEWRELNPEKAREQRWREQGIIDATWEVYDTLYKQQKGRCAICGKVAPPHTRAGLFLDHNHETRKSRGLLCRNCNAGLGMFKDSSDTVSAALNYLTPEYGGLLSGCI